MSVAEMKKAIHEKVDLLENESALNEVLAHLTSLNEKQFDVEKLFDKVVEKHGNVLAKLAQ